MINISILFLLLLLTFAQPAQAEGLQRLFTTAQERAALNAERAKPPPPKRPPIIEETSQPNPPFFITFNGLVIRSHGQRIVWINGSNELFQQDFTVELDKMSDDFSVPIILSHSKQRIWLKPGQTVKIQDNRLVPK